MSKRKMVDVEIWAEERVQYRQVVRMPMDQFEEIDSLLNRDDPEGEDAVFNLIDREDVFDSSDARINEFRLAAPERK